LSDFKAAVFKAAKALRVRSVLTNATESFAKRDLCLFMGFSQDPFIGVKGTKLYQMPRIRKRNRRDKTQVKPVETP